MGKVVGALFRLFGKTVSYHVEMRHRPKQAGYGPNSIREIFAGLFDQMRKSARCAFGSVFHLTRPRLLDERLYKRIPSPLF